jgi:shikimate 5-dehydrogenase
MLFIGVSTCASRIMELLPLWAPQLGVCAQLVGFDLPLDTGEEQYQQVVQNTAAQADILGTVITNHKLNLLAASYDHFQYPDPVARLAHEANATSKGDGLVALANDPQAVARALDDLFGQATGPGPDQQLLCCGTGGAATTTARRRRV